MTITELLFGELGFTEFFADVQAQKFIPARERTSARGEDAETWRRSGAATKCAEAAFLLCEIAVSRLAVARRARRQLLVRVAQNDHNYSSRGARRVDKVCSRGRGSVVGCCSNDQFKREADGLTFEQGGVSDDYVGGRAKGDRGGGTEG
ncbi:MAG: hypothetical protein M3268_04480, partial [Acidobacteriota bacterium]|nr:hypothetical protein [Acidobacteriota bacterium]